MHILFPRSKYMLDVRTHTNYVFKLQRMSARNAKTLSCNEKRKHSNSLVWLRTGGIKPQNQPNSREPLIDTTTHTTEQGVYANKLFITSFNFSSKTASKETVHNLTVLIFKAIPQNHSKKLVS